MKEVIITFRDGSEIEGWIENGHIYAICPNCNRVVRIDKPIFGSMHFC